MHEVQGLRPTALLPSHRAVLDTQVVLDWLVFCEPSVGKLGRAIEEGRLHWLATLPMRDELAHVLAGGVAAAWRPHPPSVLDAFDRWACVARVSPACTSTLRCDDPDDQMFIDLAVAQGARWLFTRDRALLRLSLRARDKGVVVLRPVDWIPPAQAD